MGWLNGVLSFLSGSLGKWLRKFLELRVPGRKYPGSWESCCLAPGSQIISVPLRPLKCHHLQNVAPSSGLGAALLIPTSLFLWNLLGSKHKQGCLKGDQAFLYKKLPVADLTLKPSLLCQARVISIFLCGAPRTFCHSFHNYLLYTNCMPDITRCWDCVRNKTSFSLELTFQLERQTINKFVSK